MGHKQRRGLSVDPPLRKTEWNRIETSTASSVINKIRTSLLYPVTVKFRLNIPLTFWTILHTIDQRSPKVMRQQEVDETRH